MVKFSIYLNRRVFVMHFSGLSNRVIRKKNSQSRKKHLQYNFKDSNTNGSFIVADSTSNSSLSPLENLPTSQENKHWGYFKELLLFYHENIYIVCTQWNPIMEANLTSTFKITLCYMYRRSESHPCIIPFWLLTWRCDWVSVARATHV